MSKRNLPITALAALMIASVFTGCASFSTHLTPRPTIKGEVEIGLNIDVLVTEDDQSDLVALPSPEFGVRYGISDRADLGGKISLIKGTGELNSRVAIVRESSFDLSLVPGAGVALGSRTSIENTGPLAYFSLPVLAGAHLGDAGTLVFGPKFTAHLATVSDANTDKVASTFIMYPGGVIGFALNLGEGFRLFPEINVHFPYSSEQREWGKPIFDGGLAFLIDV